MGKTGFKQITQGLLSETFVEAHVCRKRFVYLSVCLCPYMYMPVYNHLYICTCIYGRKMRMKKIDNEETERVIILVHVHIIILVHIHIIILVHVHIIILVHIHIIILVHVHIIILVHIHIIILHYMYSTSLKKLASSQENHAQLNGNAQMFSI